MEVCRAITLYSYHIPLRESSLTPEYTTIGFFDGMSTKNIPISYQEDDLKALWEYTMDQTRYCDGTYSFQNIFAMSDDEWNIGCTDADFWDEKIDCEYPLTMVVFLQLKEYISGKGGIKRQCEEFSSLARKQLEKGIVYVYGSIDKNDFIVCLKCRNYKNAVDTIKALHGTHKSVIYCYSVFSVSNIVLNDFSQSKYSYLFDEEIASICLKGVANSIRETEYKFGLDKKYWDFCEKLSAKLYDGKDRKEVVLNQGGVEESKNKDRIYDILGDNDFRYIAREVNLGRLIREFAPGGMFSYFKSNFSFYLFSSSLVLNTLTPDGTELDPDLIDRVNQGMKQAMVTEQCNYLSSILKDIFKIIENKYSGDDKILSIYYALYQLLQSFKVLEVSPAKRYDFFSMLHPFEMLVEIVKERLEQGKNIGEESGVFDFIHKISITFYSAQRTDIQFFQIPDFNVIIHYAPAKLRAFYAMWVLNLAGLYKSFKKNMNKNYSFIFAPGMFGITVVKPLFLGSRETKRLMLITLPDRAMYNIKWLTIVLSHEAAHIGCERNRQMRHESALKACTRAAILEVHAFMLYNIQRATDLLDDKVHIERVREDRSLLKELEDRLMEENQIMLDQFTPEERDDECRRVKSRENIATAFERMLCSYGEKIIADYCCYVKNDYIALKGNEQHKDNYLVDISRTFNNQQLELRRFLHIFRDVQLDKILQIIYYIEEEAFSDLITILTLEHSMEDYIRSFTFGEMTKADVFEDAEEGKAGMVRMALVIATLSRVVEHNWAAEHMSGLIDKWKEGRLEELCIGFPEGSIEEYICGQILCYMGGLKDSLDDIGSYERMYDPKSQGFVKSTYGFLIDQVVWDAMNDYLYECAEEYIKKLTTHDDIYGEKQCIANIYQQLHDGSHLDVMQIVEDFLMNNEQNCIERKPVHRCGELPITAENIVKI